MPRINDFVQRPSFRRIVISLVVLMASLLVLFSGVNLGPSNVSINGSARGATIFPSGQKNSLGLRVDGCSFMTLPHLEVNLVDTETRMQLLYQSGKNEWVEVEGHDVKSLNIIPRNREGNELPNLNVRLSGNPNVLLSILPGSTMIHQLQFDFNAFFNQDESSQFSVSGPIQMNVAFFARYDDNTDSATIEITPNGGWLLLEYYDANKDQRRSVSSARRVKIQFRDPSKLQLEMSMISEEAKWSFKFMPNQSAARELKVKLLSPIDASEVHLNDTYQGQIVCDVEKIFEIPNAAGKIKIKDGSITVLSGSYSPIQDHGGKFSLRLSGNLKTVEIDGKNILDAYTWKRDLSVVGGVLAAFASLCVILVASRDLSRRQVT